MVTSPEQVKLPDRVWEGGKSCRRTLLGARKAGRGDRASLWDVFAPLPLLWAHRQLPSVRYPPSNLYLMLTEILLSHNHLIRHIYIYILIFSFYRSGTEKLSSMSQVIELLTKLGYLPFSTSYGPNCPTLQVIHGAGAGLRLEPRSPFLKD